MKNFIHNSTIFECRYRQGYEYLDKMGLILRRFISEFPEFELKQANGNATSILNSEKNIVLNIDHNHIVIQQTQNENNIDILSFKEFSSLSDTIAQIVKEELGLDDFNQMGYRNQYFNGYDSLKECTNNLLKLKLFSNFSHKDVFPDLAEFASEFAFYENDYKIRIKLSVGAQPIKVPEYLLHTMLKDPKLANKDQKRIRKEKFLAEKMFKKLPKFVVIYDIDFIDDFPELNLGVLDVLVFFENGEDIIKKYLSKIFEVNK
jgi:hypothetical protein